MLVDMHAHAFTSAYLGLLEDAGYPGARLLAGRGVGTSDDELEARFALMDRGGAGIQVLSAGPALPYFDDTAAAVACAQAHNDELEELAARFPGRFAVLATVPMPDIDAALAEIERILDRPAFCGISLTTSLGNRPLTHAAFAPLFEELDRRGTAVLLHPLGRAGDWSHIGDFGRPDLPHGLTWLIGAPIEDTVAAIQLATSGFLTDYPNLKIVNSHLGGMASIVMRRLDNLAPMLAPKLEEKPSNLLRRMWYDTVGHGHLPALRCAVDSFGSGRLLFGTDFPYEGGDVYLASIEEVGQLGLPEAEVAGIRGTYAKELLGL